MLDVIPPMNSLSAVEAWQRDTQCLAAGDDALDIAQRCYAAAGLSNAQIAQRVLNRAPSLHDDAAIVVARHCAIAGMSFADIIDVMVELAASVPCWLDDPDAIAALVRQALAECAA